MRLKRITTNTIWLYCLYFFFVIGFFRGTALSGFEMFAGLRIVDRMFTLFQYSAMGYIIFQMSKKGKVSLTFWDLNLVLYCVLILMSTVISGVEIGEAVTHVTNIFFIVGWVRMMWVEENLKKLEAFVFSLDFLQFINFMTILAFPDGMKYANSDTIMGSVGHVYFLGYDNGLIMFALPTFFLNYYLRKRTKSRKYTFFNIMLVLSIVATGSVTGILGFLLVLFLFNTQTLFKMLGGLKGVILAIVVFVGLARMAIQSYFAEILAFLGKGNTLSGRTDIWSWAMSYIKQSPIIGYGYNTNRAREVFFWRLGISAAHSQIMDVLLQAGIIGLLLYMYIYVTGMRRSLKAFRTDGDPVWKLLFVIQTVLFFIMIVESYSSYSAYPLLFVLLALSGCKAKKTMVFRIKR